MVCPWISFPASAKQILRDLQEVYTCTSCSCATFIILSSLQHSDRISHSFFFIVTGSQNCLLLPEDQLQQTSTIFVQRHSFVSILSVGFVVMLIISCYKNKLTDEYFPQTFSASQAPVKDIRDKASCAETIFLIALMWLIATWLPKGENSHKS